MKILLIDDDPTTVESLLLKINWVGIGYEKPLTAYNADGARAQLLKEKIDVLLCDIEMPGESGLDLLEWAQDQKLDPECIFLTNHLDFAYASRAIHLHAFDYISKTESAEVVTETLRRVYEKAARKKLTARQHIYPAPVDAMNLGDHLFRDILLDEIPSTRELLTGIVSSHSFPFPADQEFLLVLLVFSQYTDNFRQMPLNEIKFIIENVLKELTSVRYTTYIVSDSAQETLYVTAVIQPPQATGQAEICADLKGIFTAAYQFFRQVTSLPPSIYIYDSFRRLWDLSQWYQAAREHDRQNAGRRYQVLVVSSDAGQPAPDSELSLPNDFLSLLENGSVDPLLQKIRQSLMQAGMHRTISPEALQKYYNDIMQNVYLLLNKYEIPASDILEAEDLRRLASYACISVIDLIKWVCVLLPRIGKAIHERQNEQAPEKLLLDFIHAHYSEHIGRNEIAEAVHLSPDYAGKIFKAATGCSINDYLIRYRIDRAKDMMLHSSRSISEIALLTGFGSFSHFSTTFRSLEGISPREFKRQSTDPA